MSFFDPAKFTEEVVQSLKEELTGKAIIAASGGVDSTVAIALASKAVGDKLLAIYVDTGYMRLGESAFVSSMLEDLLLPKSFSVLSSPSSDELQR